MCSLCRLRFAWHVGTGAGWSAEGTPGAHLGCRLRFEPPGCHCDAHARAASSAVPCPSAPLPARTMHAGRAQAGAGVHARNVDS